MQEDAPNILVSQSFSCPLCTALMGLRNELLFCSSCNMFVSRPESFHRVRTQFERQKARDIERQQQRRSAFVGVFPQRALYFSMFYVGAFIIFGVIFGTLFGAGMALAIKGVM